MPEIESESIDQNEAISNRIAEETTEGTIQEEYDKNPPLVKSDGTGKPTIDAEKPKATRKRTPGKQAVVLTDADTVIQSLSNMIEVVKYVKAVVCPEITETSAKVTRDLMIEFRKEIEQVKSKYISQIQKL